MERAKSRLAIITSVSTDIYGRDDTRQTDIVLSNYQPEISRSDHLTAVIKTTKIDNMSLGYPEDSSLILAHRRLSSWLRVGYRVGVYGVTTMGGGILGEIGISQSNALLITVGVITASAGTIHMIKSIHDGINRHQGDSDIKQGLDQCIVKKTEIMLGRTENSQNISEPAIE